MIDVSVITPLYNSSCYMRETIESVISQTFESWELLLIDDCSSDDSVAIAEMFSARDSRIKVIKLSQNSGAAVARNRGIEMARGRFIAFLDSDDLWLPDKLDTQISFMKSNSVSLSYSAYLKCNDRGEIVGRSEIPNEVIYSDLLKVCSIGCLTAVYDTQAVGKVYMPLIRKRQDLGLWLKVLKLVESAKGIDTPLAIYRIRRDSISSNKLSAARYTWRLYRDVEALRFIPALYYFIHYAFNGVFRNGVSLMKFWIFNKR